MSGEGYLQFFEATSVGLSLWNTPMYSAQGPETILDT